MKCTVRMITTLKVLFNGIILEYRIQERDKLIDSILQTL